MPNWTPNWKQLTPRLEAARRGLIVVMVLLGLAAVCVSAFSGGQATNPLNSSTHAIFRLYRVLLICFIVWCVLSKPMVTVLVAIVPFMLADWRRRALLALAVAQLFLLAKSWINFPYHAARMCEFTMFDRTEPTVKCEGRTLRKFDSFADDCRRELPESARILYHGHIEGLVFAYEVYPRRVFMLPDEYGEISRSWHKQKWLGNLPEDPLESSWQTNLPPAMDRDTFLLEHGITHEVWFSEDEPVACRWRKLQ